MNKLPLLLLLVAAPSSVLAQTPPAAPAPAAAPGVSLGPVKVGWSRKGTEFKTEDGKFKTTLQWRFQLRYNFSFDEDPRTVSGFQAGNDNAFRIRRARMKFSGHAYDPRVKHNFEYDFPSSTLLNARLSLEKDKNLGVHFGQWKIDYNRERVDSSGNQQFVERSIVNREFTLDRQDGVELYGRLFEGTLADSRWWAGVFTGAGINEANDDAHPMYMGRYQWNFLGRDLPFSQSDTERRDKPAGTLAFAAAHNQVNATRFSSSGGGNLDGFAAGSDGRYTIRQWMGEAAYQYRGFSLQHEYHWKQIRDNTTRAYRRMEGAYAQVGYFLHEAIPAVPAPLELAARYAFVDPNAHAANDVRREYTAAANWFFAGHKNKVTLDVTHFTLARAGAPMLREERARVQWDISF